MHLIRKGIDASYKTWVYHGEPVPTRQPEAQNDDHQEHNEDIGIETRGEIPKDDDQLHDMLEQIYVGEMLDDVVNELPINHERQDVRNFDKLFNAAQSKPCSGCTKTILAFIVRMLHVKVYKKLSNDAFNMIMAIIKEMLPAEDHKGVLPDFCDTYKASHTLKEKEDWIGDKCKEQHAKMVAIRDEAKALNMDVTGDYLSRTVLGGETIT